MNVFVSVDIAKIYVFTVAISAKYFSKFFLISNYKYSDGNNTIMEKILKEKKYVEGNTRRINYLKKKRERNI